MYGNTIVNYTQTQDNIVVNVASTPLSKKDDFEAVVYAASNGNCDLDTPLGKTSGAIINGTVPSSFPFTVTVTPGTAKVTTPVSSFRYPVTYEQVSTCSHDKGGNTNTPGEMCGLLQVCVEYQQVGLGAPPRCFLQSVHAKCFLLHPFAASVWRFEGLFVCLCSG